MMIAKDQVGRKNRRRGKGSPMEGLTLAEGPSGEKKMWLGRPASGGEGSVVARGGLPVAPLAREGRFGCDASAAQEEHSY